MATGRAERTLSRGIQRSAPSFQLTAGTFSFTPASFTTPGTLFDQPGEPEEGEYEWNGGDFENPYWEGAKAFWNSLQLGAAAQGIFGALEFGAGTAIAGAGGVVTFGTLGMTAPVSVPAFAGGTVLALKGLDDFTTAWHNLTNSDDPVQSQTQRALTAAGVSEDAAIYSLMPVSFEQLKPDIPGSSLAEVDPVLLKRLQLHADVDIPAGTKNIRKMMSDLTLVSGNEVALLRLHSGRRVLRMGGPNSVPVNARFVRSVIAHTHPSGRLRYSNSDIDVFLKLGQRSSAIIDPNIDALFRMAIQ